MLLIYKRLYTTVTQLCDIFCKFQFVPLSLKQI